MNDLFNAESVAEWMAEKLKKNGELSQGYAVDAIAKLFGADFVIEDSGGRPKIARTVLTAFNNLTKEDVVWSRGSQLWRYREKDDPEGRLVP